MADESGCQKRSANITAAECELLVDLPVNWRWCNPFLLNPRLNLDLT